MAVLGWAPETFWRASLAEWFAAIDGWNRRQRAESGRPLPVSREEAEDMFAREEARVARLKEKANG